MENNKNVNAPEKNQYEKDFSVIIPVWRGAAKFLPKLFDSIPENDRVEIIVVDNSKEPLQREEIQSNRNIILLHSDSNRHAGGSRNDGMMISKGKWLLFADADDYYALGAFDVFYSNFNTTAEIVFTKPEGIYEDTGEYSDRGEDYADLVHRYCKGDEPELSLRIYFQSPWCKMISHELVDRYNIRFDEICAGNDMFFSLVTGFYAKSVMAEDVVTYIVTVNRGSLTQRRDYEAIKARLYSKLHCNSFLKQQKLGKYQYSVMFALYESRKYGFLKTIEFIKMIIMWHQNPFVGINNWIQTYFKKRREEEKEVKYITR